MGVDVSIDSDVLLMTDFVNLKIKPAHSFRSAHISRVCVCVYRGECSYIYMSIYIYIIFLTKKRRVNYTKVDTLMRLPN
jgi:hypothetical protein